MEWILRDGCWDSFGEGEGIRLARNNRIVVRVLVDIFAVVLHKVDLNADVSHGYLKTSHNYTLHYLH